MTSDELDAAFTNLGKRFDQYSGGVSKTVGDALQSALAKWQDAYFGEPITAAGLATWQKAYDTASQMLDAAIAQGARATGVVAAPSKTTKALDYMLVTAGDPLSMPDLPLPSKTVFVLALVPLAYLLWR